MATVTEAKNRALEILGAKGIRQDANTSDLTRIGASYTEVYADLKTEGLAIWAEAGTIPDDIMPHLSSLMAFNAMNDFGVSNDRYSRILNTVGDGGFKSKREIRALVQPDYESEEVPKDY